METSSIRLAAEDGVELFVYRWAPDGPPRAVVQIAHGMAEHGGRYARLAGALTAAGYAVYADDHRGHGRTAGTVEDLGFFAESDGWAKCVADLWQVNPPQQFLSTPGGFSPVDRIAHVDQQLAINNKPLLQIGRAHV